MKRQTSESFRLSAILSLSGGLQDAYTYNVRGNVFANAQTGNVVLMSQNLMTGDVRTGVKYLIPIIAFALGIVLAEQIEHKLKKADNLHWRQVIILIEIILLGIVGFLPAELNIICLRISWCRCHALCRCSHFVRFMGMAMLARCV